MKNKGAFFDLDNTIIDGQSQLYFIKFLKEKKVINFLVYIKIVIWFLGYKLNILDNPRKPLEFVLGKLTNLSKEKSLALAHEFTNSIIKSKIFPDVHNKLLALKADGYKIFIISNAINLIVSNISKLIGVDDYSSTEVAWNDKNNRFELRGDINYASNKVARVLNLAEKYDVDLNLSTGFSDHHSDIPMLKLFSKPYAVNPDKKLEKVAKENNWDIIYTK